MAEDYYAVLGVSRDASQDEIKKAFRKLAHQHHPDKAGGDDAKFKQVNEAYQVLGNEQRRKQYDQYGSAFGGAQGGGAQGNPFGGFDFGNAGFGGTRVNMEDLGGFADIFGDVFGGRTRSQQQARKGADVETTVGIAFRDAVFGTERDMDFSMAVTCDRCSGNGAEPDAKIISCTQCKGAGRVEQVQNTLLGAFRTQTVCPSCRGEGKKPEKVCSQCKGDGRVRGRNAFTLKIPAGIQHGQTLRLSGKGEAAERGGTAGDLFVTVQVADDPDFTRDGDDILSEMTVPYPTAALGGTARVPTVDGDVELKIPSSTPSGKVLRIRGKGVPHVSGNGRGDHLVSVIVDVPKKLSRKAKKLLDDLRAELS